MHMVVATAIMSPGGKPLLAKRDLDQFGRFLSSPTAFGPKLFKILKDWHLHNTCKQALAKDLNYEFSLYMGYPSAPSGI
jgi:hypothetical protein